MNTKPHVLLALSVLALAAVAPAQGNLNDYVAYWDFNEGQGPALGDRSSNGLDGQVIGAQWTAGISGGGLSFDGVSQYVSIADGGSAPNQIGSLSQGSISVWFKFDSVTSTNSIHPILHLGTSNNSSWHSSVIVEIGHYGTDAELFFTVVGTVGHPIQCFDSGYPLQTGTWYHFVGVVGPNFNTGYLNGVEMTQRHYNFGSPQSHDFFQQAPVQQALWFGRGWLGSNPAQQWFDGTLDEFRIYDRPVTAADAYDLYLQGLHTYPGTLEDLVLATGVNGAPCSSGGAEDIKTVSAGDSVTVCFDSPRGTFVGTPLVLAVDLLPTAAMVVASPALDGLWLDAGDMVVLVDGRAVGSTGTTHVIAPGGNTYGFALPVWLTPQDIVVQGAAFGAAAGTGIALSPAQVLRVL